MNSPCKECPYRHIGCHDHCIKYRAFKKKIAEIRHEKALFGEFLGAMASHRDRIKRKLRMEKPHER